MRKKMYLGIAIAVAMLTGCGSADATVAETEAAANVTETPELEGYNLLWSDEFDGDTLNEEIWNKELRDPGWTNNELQEYTDSEENIYVEDGKLILKANRIEQEDGSYYYTSGKVQTQNKQDFLYGKVVARAKVPEGKGLWPAIWMMPTNEDYYGQWPKCGEIDIMEVLGSDAGTSYSTVHYGEPHAEQQGIIKLEGNDRFSKDFHEYSVEWEPGEMRFYTDDTLVLTVNDWYTAVEGEDDKPYPAPFDQTFFVQMNLAVGGNWPGNPNSTTNFDNAKFEIDYVRVYQKDEYDTNVQKPEKIFRQPLEDGNLIYNGDFSDAEALDDEDNWYFLLFKDGNGAAAIEDGTMVITTTATGTEEYSVQLVQPDLPMYKGHKYKLTFDIKSDDNRDAVVCVSAPTAGWIRYFEDTKIDLTADWQTYEFDFEVTTRDDNNGRLEFNMGAHGYKQPIYIKNVRVEDITDITE